MSYTTKDLFTLSLQDYIRLMARKLDENGFVCDMSDSYAHFVENLIRTEKMFRSATQNPTYGFAQSLGYEEIRFLTGIGLLNNGRCPICGAHSGTNYRWTAKNDSRREIEICKGCMHTHGGGTGTGNGMPSGSGCASVFILLIISMMTLIGSLGYVVYQWVM